MSLLRVVTLCTVVGWFSTTAAAQTPVPAGDKNASVSLGMAWTRDLTMDNKLLPGLYAGVDLPIGARWRAAVDGSLYRRQYENVTAGFAPRITRVAASAAIRWVRASGQGLFGQVGVGSVNQEVEGGASRDRSNYAVPTLLWIGPGVGADVKISERIGARVLVEGMYLSERVRDRRVSGRLQAGLVYWFSTRPK